MAGDTALTVEESAALLGVSVATVRRRCSAGEIKAQKVGRSWVIDGKALQVPPPRVRPRRTGTTSTLVDLEAAFKHVRIKDLRQDVWVPDLLLHEDDFRDLDSVLIAAADRIDGSQVHDAAVLIPVPKSPFFPRNAVNLSLVDRVAYHAIVASFADVVERQLRQTVYSARRTEARSRYLLQSGVDGWLAWRRAVIQDVEAGSPYMIATDVTAYFDFVKHEILLPELTDCGVDDRVLSALRRMLKEWAPAPNTGIPQGPDVSRVLGNFYMVAVDHVMAAISNVSYFRYMDDIRLVGSSRASVIAALQVLDAECRRRGLALSTKKTELLVGEEAVRSMVEPELDAAHYAFKLGADDDRALRKQLAILFKKALEPDGGVNTRWAKFSLSRLFQLRDRSVLRRVLKRLEALAPLGGLVPKYLYPWLRRPSTQRDITAFLEDPERNTSNYLSTWIMAGMLDVPDAVPDEWVDYARVIALDRAQPTYHRAIALNLLALGRHGRDLDAIREVVRREHDPEIVRAGLIALRRVGRLDRDLSSAVARRFPSLTQTIEYLRERIDLPSLVFRSRRITTLELK